MNDRAAVVVLAAVLVAACGANPTSPTPAPPASAVLPSGSIYTVPIALQTTLPADGIYCAHVPVGVELQDGKGWVLVAGGPARLTATLTWPGTATLYLTVMSGSFTVPAPIGTDGVIARETGRGTATVTWPTPTGQYFVCVNQYGGSEQPYTLRVDPAQ